MTRAALLDLQMFVQRGGTPAEAWFPLPQRHSKLTGTTAMLQCKQQHQLRVFGTTGTQPELCQDYL
jgi:hypothetical protein